MIPSIKAGSIVAAAGIASAHTFGSDLAGSITVGLAVGVFGFPVWSLLFRDLRETCAYKREMKRGVHS